MPMSSSTTISRTVLILLFPDVEILDFCGPYEVFSAANEVASAPPFHVMSVGESLHPLRTRGGLTVIPHTTFGDAPPADLLVLPGGHGTHAALRSEATLAWIRTQATSAEVVLSVCTGARLLAALGLLDHRRATTHHSALENIAAMAPTAAFTGGVRFIDEGPVITAAGVSAGIDAALHLVGRLCSPDIARLTAEYMEWPALAP